MDTVNQDSTEVVPGTELPDIDAVQLQRLIPHRIPMLFVDRVEQLRAFESARGVKCVAVNEWYFQGHFPGDPIMPGVMIVEAMAQTAAALVVSSRQRDGEGDGVYFMAIDEARFRRPVRPGDVLYLDVEKVRQKLGIWRFKGVATVNGKPVANAEFSAKVFDGGS